MEGNNLKISADLAAYIKSVVNTEIKIYENANQIPTYSMYSYSAMSASSVDTNAITIEGQDIVDYCEEMKIDVDSNQTKIDNLDKNKLDNSEFEKYKTTIEDNFSSYDSNLSSINENIINIQNKLTDKVDNSEFTNYKTQNEDNLSEINESLNKKVENTYFTNYKTFIYFR